MPTTPDFLKHTPPVRVRLWREFRTTLTADQDDLSHLRAVLAFWSRCPLVPYFIDWDRPETWPGPWEILGEDEICPTGMAILMAQTLLLADPDRWAGDRLRIRVLRDPVEGYLSVVQVDDRHILDPAGRRLVPFREFARQSAIVGSYFCRNGKYVDDVADYA